MQCIGLAGTRDVLCRLHSADHVFNVDRDLTLDSHIQRHGALPAVVSQGRGGWGGGCLRESSVIQRAELQYGRRENSASDLQQCVKQNTHAAQGPAARTRTFTNNYWACTRARAHAHSMHGTSSEDGGLGRAEESTSTERGVPTMPWWLNRLWRGQF